MNELTMKEQRPKYQCLWINEIPQTFEMTKKPI